MDRSLDDFPPEGHRPRSRGDRGSRDHGDRPHRYRNERHRGDRHHSGGPSIDSEADDRTLFVANLNYSTSWQELRDHLRRGR